MTIESRLENMQTQLNSVCELLQLTISAFNTKKSVAKFLNKSEKTIDNYIKNNIFIEGKHYFINEKQRVEFIPYGIVLFKKNPQHKITQEENKEKKEKIEKLQLSETTSKILKGVIDV